MLEGMTGTAVPPIAELLEFAAGATREAGHLALEFFGRPMDVEWKTDGSPRTRADIEVEKYLRRTICRVFPEHGILGEELGEQLGAVPVRWIIDPIDGTQTFIRGVPLFGTLVSVEVAGDPVVGVVFLPALGEEILAGRGLGCTWNGSTCRVSRCSDLRQALVTVSDQTAISQYSRSFGRLAERSAMQRSWGDCYAYALVATGRAEIALDYEMSIWDNAALMMIVEEAGGRFTDWLGHRTIHSCEVVATNGLLHQDVLDLMGEAPSINLQ